MTNVTLNTFQKFSDLKIFPECFCGKLKMLWQATCGPRAANCPPLVYEMIENAYINF